MADRFRVLSVHLHLTSEGVLAAVMERRWKGALPDDVLLQRVHIEEVNIQSDPADILHAVAALYSLQHAFSDAPPPA